MRDSCLPTTFEAVLYDSYHRHVVAGHPKKHVCVCVSFCFPFQSTKQGTLKQRHTHMLFVSGPPRPDPPRHKALKDGHPCEWLVRPTPTGRVRRPRWGSLCLGFSALWRTHFSCTGSLCRCSELKQGRVLMAGAWRLGKLEHECCGLGIS